MTFSQAMEKLSHEIAVHSVALVFMAGAATVAGPSSLVGEFMDKSIDRIKPGFSDCIHAIEARAVQEHWITGWNLAPYHPDAAYSLIQFAEWGDKLSKRTLIMAVARLDCSLS